jgi:TonB-dependent SusC/RagA subfamily outer membrane receptor
MKPARAGSPKEIILITTVLLAVAGCSHGPPPEREIGSLASPVGSRAEVLERDDLTAAAANMEQLLADRLPGVMIRHAGSRAWVEIRGPGSISASTEALIIIDGVENTTRGLLAMNPAYVQRIQVLKGASAAIYGMRSGNGVLVVTTRREGQ